MAKTVNYGDPLTQRLTLRLTDRQYDFLIKVSGLMGVSPSDYLRMVINTSMVSTSKSLDYMISGNVGMLEGKDGGTSNENVNADSNNLV